MSAPIGAVKNVWHVIGADRRGKPGRWYCFDTKGEAVAIQSRHPRMRVVAGIAELGWMGKTKVWKVQRPGFKQ